MIKPQTVLDVLRAAKAKIASPAVWCKGAFAKTADGGTVSKRPGIDTWDNPRACQWCAWGAIKNVVSGGADARLESHALATLSSGISKYTGKLSGVVSFNDRSTTTHADVMAAFDKAIAIEQVNIL